MDATVSITLWAALFLGTHFALSSATVRPRLISAVGQQGFLGIYSLVASATLGPLIYEFAYHKHAGPILWYLRANPPIGWLAWILMYLALVLFVASLINPNPGGLGAPKTGSSEPHGVLKITRHPGFVAFTLFGLAHLLMNGWLGDAIFFATFPALGIFGGIHQDARKIRDLGEPYREFKAKTSFVPFAALISGGQRWTSSDVPWAAIGAGTVLAIALVALHPIIFGGHPLG